MRLFRPQLAPTLLALALAGCRHAAPPPTTEARAQGKRSDENARLLLDVLARFSPEQAARLGLPGLDDRISDLAPGHLERYLQALREAAAQLEQRAAAEKDPEVARDLEILLQAARRQIRGAELTERLEVPYVNLPRLVFSGVRALLDDQVDPARRPAALARVRKYAGLEPGTTPIAQLADAETLRGLGTPGLLPPSKLEVESDLQTASFLIDGIDKLFAQYKIEGAEPALAALRGQLARHLELVRTRVLPRAREDFRLPPALYAFRLEQAGVDIPAAELALRARAAFTEIQGEMQAVAARVAKARKLANPDYRAVIQELKKDQIPDAKILAHYRSRLSDLESLIRAHRLVTLPQRPARIRLGTPAENAQQPAPHMQPPRLIGNQGEQGEFVLPLSVPGATVQKYDDFNFSAASWTLTAHEARPGHELQFATLVERGVSLARAVFAFNSVNAEGWGLYAEAIMLPYMPDEGKLISLQLRLQRAARAFVDPELQMGKWTPPGARSFLMSEVGLSPAFATEEVDRFTFRAPGQATAYFYGYTRLLELRDAAEKQLGQAFDAQAFHDLILAQGLLPPDLMRKAVLGALERDAPAAAGR